MAGPRPEVRTPLVRACTAIQRVQSIVTFRITSVHVRFFDTALDVVVAGRPARIVSGVEDEPVGGDMPTLTPEQLAGSLLAAGVVTEQAHPYLVEALASTWGGVHEAVQAATRGDRGGREARIDVDVVVKALGVPVIAAGDVVAGVIDGTDRFLGRFSRRRNAA